MRRFWRKFRLTVTLVTFVAAVLAIITWFGITKAGDIFTTNRTVWIAALGSFVFMALLLSFVVLLKKIRQLKSQACVFPSGCVMRITESTQSSKEGLADLYREGDTFAQLIRSQKARKYSEEVFTGRALKAREDESASIHVLFATLNAMAGYYTREGQRWVAPEEDSNGSRKRLIVIEKEFGEAKEFKEKLSFVCKTFVNTSNLRAIADNELAERHPSLLRDFGIFRSRTDNKLTGFFTFLSAGSRYMFSLYTGDYYIVRDQDYLEDAWKKFESAWQDNGLKSEFNFWNDYIKQLVTENT